MADLTRNNPSNDNRPVGIGSKSLLLDTGEADVKKNAILKYNTGDSSSVQHGGDDASAEFAGIAVQAGSAGEYIDVETEGIFGPYTHADGSLTDANIGDVVCMGADDNSVTSFSSATNKNVIGVIHSVPSATTVDVLVGLGLKGAIDHSSSGGGLTASEVALADAGGNYAAATVEAAFAELASASNGEGASIIKIEDSGGIITATEVEGALAENRAAIDVLEALPEVTNGVIHATGNQTIATVTRAAGAPTAGVYTIDCSGTFSAITEVLGWAISTAPADPTACATLSLGPSISSTDVTMTWRKEDASTAADDASVVFTVTCLGTAV
jgi:hypothetical protein